MSKIEEIKEAFECFDTDKSGKISKKKVGAALRCLNIPVTNAEIEEYIKGLKSVDFKTFESIVVKANTVQRPTTSQVISSTSTIFTTEIGDAIDIQDLRLTLLTTGEKLTDEEVDEILQHADYDANGNISMQNFLQLVQQK